MNKRIINGCDVFGINERGYQSRLSVKRKHKKGKKGLFCLKRDVYYVGFPIFGKMSYFHSNNL